MIGDAFSQVDMVTVENSQTTNTYVDVLKGMRIERGMTSKYFINDHKRQECVLENPYILISDHEINNLMNLEKILAPIVSQGKSLLIIGELGANALATLNMNVAQGKIKACHIMPPNFGYRQKDLLEDLAIALDGTYFSEDTGDDLSLIDVAHLGRCASVSPGLWRWRPGWFWRRGWFSRQGWFSRRGWFWRRGWFSRLWPFSRAQWASRAR